MEHVHNWDYKQLDIHASQNLHFEFKDVNILSPFTVSQTFAAANLCLSLFLTLILNNSIVFFSSSLNKLNVLSTFHKVMHINIAQNLQFRHCWIKVYSRYNHHVMASFNPPGDNFTGVNFPFTFFRVLFYFEIHLFCLH